MIKDISNWLKKKKTLSIQMGQSQQSGSDFLIIYIRLLITYKYINTLILEN